ncbi:MAG: acetyltransferase [Tannerella sp.]|jgi:acetyltransferase EpsM|nr:acetyltransferase [Tannerella sp.]
MYLIGASGHAKVVIDLIRMSGGIIDGVFDDNSLINDLLGYKRLGEINKAPNVNGSFIITIGDNSIRKNIVEKMNLHYESVTGNCHISQDASIGEGTVVMNGACINIGTRIGNHVIINTAACIDHECVINNFVHVSPNATLAGNVRVEEGAHIGLGAQVIQGVSIGKWATIGAGAVIIKNVPDYAVVVGVPGRIIKYNQYNPTP